MKVALVNPPRFEGISVVREERCEVPERYSVLEPYSLLQLAALLRDAGHSVRLLDANGADATMAEAEAWLRSAPYDALIFRFTPTTFNHDTSVARVSKHVQPDARTIGLCWTLRTVPRDVMADAPGVDIFLRHEYESVGIRLIEALEQGGPLELVPGLAFRNDGHVVVTSDATPIKDYDALPMPAYDLLPSLDPYFISAPACKPFTIMYASKGCPYACSFCTVARTAWRFRSADSVLEELRYLEERFDIRTVSFFDETFTMNKKRVRELCEGMRREGLDIRWYCNTRVHLVEPELLRTMRAAGCSGISFGVESGNQRVLDQVSKQATVEQAAHAIQWAKEAGIKTYCAFILGLPGETEESAMDTIRFAMRTLPNGAQFNVLAPYPGTELYETLRREGVIPELDWRKMYQDDAVVGTQGLTKEELNRLRKLAYSKLYLNPRWWRQNVRFALSSRDDFELASRYAIRVLRNYFVHGMRGTH
ncbi:MAG: radical SAM protein [Methanobacteriota archaeon]|nr:MAG: radical SAM protein [Euryarchaeota archaeon]